MWLRRKLRGLNVNSIAGAGARDYFILFQLNEGLALDVNQLERRYHSLMQKFHPDLYAGKPQIEQRLAAQLCADINSGYQLLRNEVTRAEYLLRRAGVDLEEAERTGVSSDFLMMQISLREQLETLKMGDTAAYERLSDEVEAKYSFSRDAFEEAVKTAFWKSAAGYWQEMCYLEKLRKAVRTAHYRGH